MLDLQGRLLGAAAFSTNAAGYARLLDWLRGHGRVVRVGVESTGACAAGLARALSSAGIDVVEVNQPHPHARQRLGKSDPIDAELAARAALSGQATAVPKQTTGIVEAIRQLGVARNGALKARTATLQQLDDLIITAPEQLRDQLRQGRTLKARARPCSKLRPDRERLDEPTHAAKLALRSLAHRIEHPYREIHELDQQLEQLVIVAAPRTIQLQQHLTSIGTSRPRPSEPSSRISRIDLDGQGYDRSALARTSASCSWACSHAAKKGVGAPHATLRCVEPQ